jgi:hypothetical protein
MSHHFAVTPGDRLCARRRGRPRALLDRKKQSQQLAKVEIWSLPEIVVARAFQAPGRPEKREVRLYREGSGIQSSVESISAFR